MDVSADLLVNALVAGLLLGGFYAAVTVGISISFGILDIVNIAHPGFIIVGSYVALGGATIWVAQLTGEPQRVLGLVRTRFWRAVGLTIAAFIASVAIAYPLEQIFHGAEEQGFEPNGVLNPGRIWAGV